MMLMNPNKKAIQVLVGKLKAPSFVQKLGDPSQAVGQPSAAVKVEGEPEASEMGYALEAASAKLMRCMEAKDAKGCAMALKEAFTILEAMEEAEEEESEGQEG